MSPIEKESQPLSAFGKKDGAARNEPQEAPEFKPRKRRKKLRLIPIVLWLLFLLSAGAVGVARFAPALIPADLMTYLPPSLLWPPSTTPTTVAVISTATSPGEIIAPTTLTNTPEPASTPTIVPT